MSPEIKSPDIQALEATLPDTEQFGELHGATYIDEWTSMPEPESAVSDLSAVEPEVVQPLIETNEVLKDGSRIRIAALGAIAAAESIGKDAKGRFLGLATRFHVWKNTTNSEQPLAQPAAATAGEAPATRHIVSAAAEAKSADDWMGYQREILKFAEAADQTQEDQTLGKEALRSRVRRADAKVDAVVAGDHVEPDYSELTAQKVAESQQRLSNNEYLKLDNIIGLKKSIEEEVSKKLPDIKIAGDNYVMGESPDKLRQEVTQKLLSEYFGASPEELEAGEKVRQIIQMKVAELLALPIHELQARQKAAEATEQTTTDAAIKAAKPQKPTRSDVGGAVIDLPTVIDEEERQQTEKKAA